MIRMLPRFDWPDIDDTMRVKRIEPVVHCVGSFRQGATRGRGRPAHVLLTFDDYQRLAGGESRAGRQPVRVGDCPGAQVLNTREADPT
jgi:hypothetical protein